MTVVRRWEEVPQFASEAEEAAFWATHELDDSLLGQMTPDADPLLPAPRPRTRPVALRFDEHLIRRAKALASRRGKGYQTMLKEFVTERLYEEERREGILETVPTTSARAERRPDHGPAVRIRREGTMRGGAKKGDRHVVPAPKGGWDVKAPGARRASSHHDTQAEATHRAREIVRNAGGGEVVVHHRRAAIRDTVSP
jgi:predicted DNA binding CopG/RHH family protein